MWRSTKVVSDDESVQRKSTRKKVPSQPKYYSDEGWSLVKQSLLIKAPFKPQCREIVEATLVADAICFIAHNESSDEPYQTQHWKTNIMSTIGFPRKLRVGTQIGLDIVNLNRSCRWHCRKKLPKCSGLEWWKNQDCVLILHGCVACVTHQNQNYNNDQCQRITYNSEYSNGLLQWRRSRAASFDENILGRS